MRCVDKTLHACRSCQDGRGALARSRGFSKLELAVVAVVISVLAAVLLNRLHYYQELAEKAAMEYTIQTIQSELRMRTASMLVQGRAHQYATLTGQNPMEWLQEKPANYLGQLQNPRLTEAQAGNWYFDVADRTLIYLVRNGEHFQRDTAGQKRVRLRISAMHSSFGRGPEYDVTQIITSMAVAPVEPYRWF